jgi:hypothetical protein
MHEVRAFRLGPAQRIEIEREGTYTGRAIVWAVDVFDVQVDNNRNLNKRTR